MKAPISSDILDPKIKTRTFLSTIWMAWTQFVDDFIDSVNIKNEIINGSFDLWTEATSQTSSGYGSDDLWFNSHSGSTKTHSRQSFTLGQTDVPGNPKYFSRTAVTSSAGSSNLCLKQFRIENVSSFSGENITLSLYAREPNAAKNMAIEFEQNFGTGGSPSSPVLSIGVSTIQLTTLFKRYIITTKLPSISGKTLGSNGDDGLRLNIWFDAGSDYNSRTNSLGQQSGTFDLACIQLVKGTKANKCIAIEVDEETRRRDRFLRYGYSSVVGYAGIAGEYMNTVTAWDTPMRATPTVTNLTNTSTNCAINGFDVTQYGFRHEISSAAGGTFYSVNQFWRADARL